MPLRMPYSVMASVAYREHVGSYLHRRGSAGEIRRRYTTIGAITSSRAIDAAPLLAGGRALWEELTIRPLAASLGRSAPPAIPSRQPGPRDRPAHPLQDVRRQPRPAPPAGSPRSAQMPPGAAA